MSDALVIAGHALREAVRRRVLLVVALLTAVFLGLFALAAFEAFDSLERTPAGGIPIDEQALAGGTLLGLAMFVAQSPMRSTTPAILSAAMISRRSSAMGARRAMTRTASSSTWLSSLSSLRSRATTPAASSSSPLTSARSDSWMPSSARPPISAISPRSRVMSSSNALTVCSAISRTCP